MFIANKHGTPEEETYEDYSSSSRAGTTRKAMSPKSLRQNLHAGSRILGLVSLPGLLRSKVPQNSFQTSPGASLCPVSDGTLPSSRVKP